jgi:malonyl-CoA decarboxylase
VSRISYLSELLSSVFARDQQHAEFEERGSFAELCDALLSQSGEMSGNRLARGLLKRFGQSSEEEKHDFFQMLAERFDINAEHAVRAAQRYADHKSDGNLTILMDSVEPKRQELFRRLNRVPGATNELVQMRASLLSMLKDHPELKAIDVDFQRLFRAWFNQGFLVLREIDWHTPANVLEKIIAYEAVHEISNWSELRSRLEPVDRRCFAFFHPAMLDEPLIFVAVALTKSSPGSIEEVLELDRAGIADEEATMAVFYSISNCQRGLAGVSFGNFLIKQVAKELSRQLPNLTTFRTLSPVPGFMRWVNQTVDASDESGITDEMAHLRAGLRIAKRLTDQDKHEATAEELEQLRAVVAHYLVKEQRADHLPIDPVARFHLGNGASLDAVIPSANVSRKGLEQSASAMVSYLYNLDKVEDNHEAYANNQTVIHSSEVAGLLEPNRRLRKRAG